jgi:hypothetical protein
MRTAQATAQNVHIHPSFAHSLLTLLGVEAFLKHIVSAINSLPALGSK